MPYCGKPSRGCQMCRTRRIKCDETKPTCNQCLRSRRQCPGYKDEFDLVFRNETKATENRARRVNRKRTGATARSAKAGQEPISPISLQDERSPTSKTACNKSPLGMAIVPALQVPIETRATCHFLSNFVLVPQQGNTRGFMDYLVPLLKAEAPNGPLQHAFNACALASLGNCGSYKRSGFALKAIEESEEARKSLVKLISDPEASKSDGVLAAVLLLGMYENINAQEVGDFSWGTHIEAAINIVKQRGRKQLRTKTGLLLFVAVRTQLIVHTLTTGKAPVMGTEWWINDAVKDEAATLCQKFNLQTSELRAEVTRAMAAVSRTPDNINLMISMKRRAEALDQDVIAWMKATPKAWQYRQLCWEDHVPNGDFANAEVFPGRVDVYSDFWIASVWNMARTTRLILNSVIVRCAAWICSPVDYRTTREYAAAARTATDMITDILASVPYHLGWHAKRKHLFRREDDVSGSFVCGDDDSLKGLAGYFLTWPLACVIGQDYTTDAQRAFVRGRLRCIGNELGVKYAYILSQLQVRIPSMLIRRDGMMAQPYPMAHNFEKLLSARSAPPSAGYTMNPLQQREAMQAEQFEKGRATLLTQAAGTAGESGQWVAKKWLSI